MARGLGSVQKKILLLLLGGLALGLAGSPRRYFKILKEIGKGWEAINREALRKSIRSLYENHLIDTTENQDGTITIVLTEQGTEKAKTLTFNFDKIDIQSPAKWDRKWRIVIFDIPDYLKKVREAFRFQLRRLEFYPLQKSVFVHPFECQNEIDFLIEFFEMRRYVRQITADYIDNELHLKEIFKKSFLKIKKG